MSELSLPDPFATLSPTSVWRHFATLCAIPRPSKGEARLRDHLQQWALSHGLGAEVDAVGNLLLSKPAAAGYESAPGVVLQAHLDMVCQKNSGCTHDFTSDPIRPVLREGWLRAEATTLGADNGIGVALMLAVLEDQTLAHGPLEVLLTVDEEAGMGGARGLTPGWLKGRLMLNLDTEAWGEFYLGCAGGLDVNVAHQGTPVDLPKGMKVCSLTLSGLRGGHSGVDIHEGRGNAIKLLVRALQALNLPFELAALQGGTARNALPREATAVLALSPEAVAMLPGRLAEIETMLRAELAGVDEGLRLQLGAGEAAQVLSAIDREKWLNLLHAAPHGVKRMSSRLAGVVETSNNLGMVTLSPGAGECNFMVRSLVDSAAKALADEIISLCALAGMDAVPAGAYPGWSPNPASPLLQRCQAVFSREFSATSSVQVIHAGLECGLIGAVYPGMDIVSFGPTIRGAHAPGEAVEVASVARCWQLLTAILADLR